MPWRSLALSSGIHLALGLPLIWLNLDPRDPLAAGKSAANGPLRVAQVEVQRQTGPTQGERWDAEPLPQPDPIPALPEPSSEAWFPAIPSTDATQDPEPIEFLAPLELPLRLPLEPKLQVVPPPPAEAGLPQTNDGQPEPSPPTPVATGLAHASVSGDAEPIALECPPPSYPRLARRNRWQGALLCRLTISKNGTVTQVLVERSSGRRILDQAAISALLLWRFEPGIRAGRAAETEILHRIVFRLE